MMRKKNTVAVLICIMILGVTCFTACGSSKEQENSSKKNEDGQLEDINHNKDKIENDEKENNNLSNEKSNGRESSDKNKDDKQVSADEGINNKGTVIQYGNDTYYWKYNAGSFEDKALFQNYYPKENAENKLICVSDDGSEEVIYTGDAGGELYIVGDRLYFLKNVYNDAGYAYTNELVYMEFENGKLKTDDIYSIGKGTIVAADSKRNVIIYFGDLGDDRICLYAIDNNSNENTFIGYDVSFVAYDEGTVYYQDYSAIENDDDARNGSVALCKSDLKGNTSLIVKTEPDLYDIASGGRCEIECAQILDDIVYFSYGRYDGTAHLFQGGNVVRVTKDGSGFEVLASVGDNNAFYVYTDNEGEKLVYQKSYTKNIELDLNTKSEKETDKPAGAVGKVFSVYYDDSREVKYYFYKNADGKVLELISDSAYLTSDEEENVSFKDMECIDNYFYYRIDYGMHNPESDLGWRYSYDREKTEVYRKNLETGEIELLYEY